MNQYSETDIQALMSGDPMKNKTQNELTSLICHLFQNPEVLTYEFQDLGGKFTSDQTNHHYKSNHGIDIEILLKFYENIDRLKLNQSIKESLKNSLEALESTERLEKFVSQKGNVKFFYVVMFWHPLFSDRANNEVLLKFLNLIYQLGANRTIFKNWCDDISAEYLKMQVENLLLVLEDEFKKLLPGGVDDSELYIVYSTIQNICEFLSLLYDSNKKVPRLLNEHFIQKNIAKYYEPIYVFKQYLTQKQEDNLIQYPFILNLDFKYELLRIESAYEQKINMQKNVSNGLRNLMNGHVQLDANGNFSLESLAYLHFQINRNNILDDSMEKLGKVKHNLKNPLRIQFIGEEGADEGGVQNEYFHILTEQIFRGYLDMFVSKNNSRVYWFNSFSFEPPIRFEFVGMLFGIAIYNSVHLDIKFPKILYQKLLSGDENEMDVHELLEQLNEIEPSYYQSLKQIIDSHESLDELELYFTIEIENYGEKMVYDLVEDGSEIKLCQDNKNEYVYMICEFFLNKNIEKQFNSFKKGFDRVVDTELIKMFTPSELEIIITGEEVIDFKELEANAQYEGYTKESPVIINLWKVLNELSLLDKKAFLMFCTGSDRAPIGGLKSLKFIVQKHANTTHLPSAHTCFNVLLLPEYENIEKLRKNIELIIKNNQGFGLI